MADAPERIILQPCPTYGWDHPDHVKHAVGHAVEYIRADLTPPAAVIEAMEQALRQAMDNAVADDLDPWFADAKAALADLDKWRVGK